MVAYSFKKQFVEPIRAGTKIGTIRAHRKRHARPGEDLQLYCGMRTRGCFLIAPKVCVRVNEIVFDLTGQGGPVLTSNGVPVQGWPILDQFARTDGFKDFAEMLDFWETAHGAIRFEGVHIIWGAP